jgi:hypothetical protein
MKCDWKALDTVLPTSELDYVRMEEPDQEKQHTMQPSSVFSVVKSFSPTKWKSNRTGQPCVSSLARIRQVAGVGGARR